MKQNKLNTIFIVLTSFVFFVFADCKKDKVQYKIKGTVFQSCDLSEPNGQAKLILEYNTKSLFENSFEIPITTNAQGQFEVVYETVGDNINGQLNIAYQNGFSNASLVSDLPHNKSLDLGNLVTGKNSFYIRTIKTTKAYSDKDTLFYKIGYDIKDAPFVLGPFYNGQILDTVERYSMMEFNDTLQMPTILVFNTWALGLKYYDPKRKNYQYHKILPCSNYQNIEVDLTQAIK